jgi:integrase
MENWTQPKIKNISIADLAGKKERVIVVGPNLSLKLFLTKDGELTKTYQFRSKLNGKMMAMSIGSTNIISLSEAMKKAAEYKQQVLQGLDPTVQKVHKIKEQEAAKAKIIEEKKAEKIDFRHVAFDFIEDARIKGLAAGTIKLYEYAFTEDNLLHIYYKQLNKITEDEINICLKNKSSTPSMANRIRAFIQQVVNYAKNTRLYRAYTPDIIWKNVLKFEEAKDTYFLEEEKIADFIKALEHNKPVHQAMFLIYLLTGVRKEELLTATREQYNPETNTLTIAGKTDRLRKEKLREIPLPFAFKPIIESLLSYHNSNYLLFSNAEHPNDRIYDIKKAVYKVKENANIPNFSGVHDLRRAFNNIPQFSDNFMTLSGAEAIRYAIMGHIEDTVNAKHYTNVPAEKKRKYLDTWLSHITELSGLDLSAIASRIKEDAEYNNARMVRLSKPLFRQGKTYKTPAGGTYTYLRGKHPTWSFNLNQEELDALIIG